MNTTFGATIHVRQTFPGFPTELRKSHHGSEILIDCPMHEDWLRRRLSRWSWARTRIWTDLMHKREQTSRTPCYSSRQCFNLDDTYIITSDSNCPRPRGECLVSRFDERMAEDADCRSRNGPLRSTSAMCCLAEFISDEDDFDPDVLLACACL